MLAAAEEKVRDPICGMTVDPASAKHRVEHAGSTYHFCCAGCADKFRRNPASALEKQANKPRPAPKAAGK